MLPLVYVWPLMFAVGVTGILVLLAVNLFLGVCLLGAYLMLPQTVVDAHIQAIVKVLRKVFSVDRIEANLKETFLIEGGPFAPTSIYLWHPHSLSCLTSVIHTTFLKTISAKLTCHSLFFWIPIIRDVFRVGGGISADYETMRHHLRTESVVVFPGGTSEILRDIPSKTIVSGIKTRRGVFRLALKEGVSLVPVLTYGEAELFPAIPNPLNQFLYKWFGIAVPLTSMEALRNWMRLSHEPLPPVRTFVGDELRVEKNETPTLEDIDALKARYSAALQTLFDKTAPSGYVLEE